MAPRLIPGATDYYADEDGNIYTSCRGNELRLMKARTINEYGYQMVDVKIDGRRRKRYVHQLVLETFVGPRPDGHETRHRDGDPTNNRLSNLLWGTKAQNVADKVAHGSHRGSRSGFAKLHEAQVERIVAALRGGQARKSIAAEHGVTVGAIDMIATGKRWSHMTGGHMGLPRKKRERAHA